MYSRVYSKKFMFWKKKSKLKYLILEKMRHIVGLKFLNLDLGEISLKRVFSVKFKNILETL